MKIKTMRPVAITAPSLNPQNNISGISALVSPLIREFPDCYLHIQAGTPDGMKGIISRIQHLCKTVFAIVKHRIFYGTQILHLNTATNPASVARDIVVLALSKMMGYKVLLHLHGGKWLTEERPNVFKRSLVRLMWRLSSKLVVLGAEETDQLSSIFKIKDKVAFLPNFHDAPYFINPRKSSKRLVFLGRLVESKNVGLLPSVLRQVIKQHPDAHLSIFGDGPLREVLLAELSTIPNNHWTYGGLISGKEKWEQLTTSDVFILPSNSGEGMPIAMLESMACGCVPIVTNLGSISSVIIHGENGIICDPKDIQSFIDATNSLLSSKSISCLKSSALETAREYSLTRYHQSLTQLYFELKNDE